MSFLLTFLFGFGQPTIAAVPSLDIKERAISCVSDISLKTLITDAFDDYDWPSEDAMAQEIRNDLKLPPHTNSRFIDPINVYVSTVIQKMAQEDLFCSSHIVSWEVAKRFLENRYPGKF